MPSDKHAANREYANLFIGLSSQRIPKNVKRFSDKMRVKINNTYRPCRYFRPDIVAEQWPCEVTISSLRQQMGDALILG